MDDDLSSSYPGRNPFSYRETSVFIRDSFLKLIETCREKDVYVHHTCATNTENVRFVFNAISDMLRQQQLSVVGLY